MLLGNLTLHPTQVILEELQHEDLRWSRVLLGRTEGITHARTHSWDVLRTGASSCEQMRAVLLHLALPLPVTANLHVHADILIGNTQHRYGLPRLMLLLLPWLRLSAERRRGSPLRGTLVGSILKFGKK